MSISVDFETIQQGMGIFKCPFELHLDANYQNIIHSNIQKPLVECQPESEKMQRLSKSNRSRTLHWIIVGYY